MTGRSNIDDAYAKEAELRLPWEEESKRYRIDEREENQVRYSDVSVRGFILPGRPIAKVAEVYENDGWESTPTFWIRKHGTGLIICSLYFHGHEGNRISTLERYGIKSRKEVKKLRDELLRLGVKTSSYLRESLPFSVYKTM